LSEQRRRRNSNQNLKIHNEELKRKLRMIRMTIFQNKAEEELIWMLLLHTYKKKTSFRMKRQKPNHETLTFDEEDVKEEP